MPSVLMVAPDYFRIQTIDNPHMEGQTVDMGKSRQQWYALKAAYESIGVRVVTTTPKPSLPDMVFPANPILCGPPGSNLVAPSRMRNAGRRPETDVLLAALPGHKIVRPNTEGCYEGHGDFLWTPKGDLIAAHGPRTDADAIPAVAACFGATPLIVKLVDPRFYHLDTCLAILNDTTALWVPEAFDEASKEALNERFRLLDVGEDAMLFAANAHCPDGHNVLIDAECKATIELLKSERFAPIPVDTSEFRKSGGSVFCLKHVID